MTRPLTMKLYHVECLNWNHVLHSPERSHSRQSPPKNLSTRPKCSREGPRQRGRLSVGGPSPPKALRASRRSAFSDRRRFHLLCAPHRDRGAATSSSGANCAAPLSEPDKRLSRIRLPTSACTSGVHCDSAPVATAAGVHRGSGSESGRCPRWSRRWRRALPSPGVTRLHRYYDAIRLLLPHLPLSALHLGGHTQTSCCQQSQERRRSQRLPIHRLVKRDRVSDPGCS